jgi:hypothetical protein
MGIRNRKAMERDLGNGGEMHRKPRITADCSAGEEEEEEEEGEKKMVK